MNPKKPLCFSVLVWLALANCTTASPASNDAGGAETSSSNTDGAMALRDEPATASDANAETDAVVAPIDVVSVQDSAMRDSSTMDAAIDTALDVRLDARMDVSVSMSDAAVSDASSAGCQGYATRYWDCCKAHCGWHANAAPVAAVTSCSQTNGALSDNNTASSCSGGGAFTCFNMAPWAVSETLSYGFAAVPASGGICGRCYQLTFDGTGHYDANDTGSRALAGRSMIVQATNIGHDVSGGQFDVLIPGGGVGAFNACSRQWGVPDSALGAQYGGFLTACRASSGSYDAYRACVRSRCETVFADARFSDLRAGCLWFVDWYRAADNPNLRYREVPCPDALVRRSGVDRRPLNDVAAPMCSGGGSTCTCDCSWTAGGRNCGTDDGSCCWRACCGGG